MGLPPIFLGFDLKLLQSNFLSFLNMKGFCCFGEKSDLSFLGSLSSKHFSYCECLGVNISLNRPPDFLGLEQVASVDVPLSGAQKRERQL